MRIALAVLAFALTATPALAQERLVMKPSKFPVKETMDKLAAAVEAKGLRVVARVDHNAGARAENLPLKPTEVIMFGNPKIGTPLMQVNRHAGIDLPMRVLAWEDDKGKTWVGYVSPQTLKRRYRIRGKDQDAALKTMAGALEAFAKAATE